MRVSDVRELSDEDLQRELQNVRRELMNLRFRAATMQLADVNEIKRSRRRVARIKTVIRQRELTKVSQ